MTEIRIGPVTFVSRTPTDITAAIERAINDHGTIQLITLNALMYLAATHNPDLLNIINTASLVVPDSVGITAAIRFLTGRSVPRIAGIDLMERLCGDAARTGHRVFLLGAEPGIAEAAAAALKQRYPGLMVAGTHHGYFDQASLAYVLKLIAAAQPHYLFVALDVPRQERWIARHVSELRVPLVMGVGGSFDVISGRLRRAPGWMQRTGLEWLFRLVQQPSRWQRMAQLPVFACAVLKLKFTGK